MEKGNSYELVAVHNSRGKLADYSEKEGMGHYRVAERKGKRNWRERQTHFYVKPRKISGIFEAKTKPFMALEPILKNKTYSYRIKLNPVIIPKKPLDFKTLVGELSFITNKKYWGAYLQGRAMYPISEDDYKLIKQRLGMQEKSKSKHGV